MANRKKGFKTKIKRRTTTRIKNGKKISGKGGWSHAGRQVKNTKRMLESIAKEETAPLNDRIKANMELYFMED